MKTSIKFILLGRINLKEACFKTQPILFIFYINQATNIQQNKDFLYIFHPQLLTTSKNINLILAKRQAPRSLNAIQRALLQAINNRKLDISQMPISHRADCLQITSIDLQKIVQGMSCCHFSQCFQYYIIQHMGKKIKSKECKGRWCENHLFSIRPKFQKDWKTKDQTVRLCPKYDNIRKQLFNSLPQINQDQKYYTPLFIAHQDQKHYTEYDERNRTVFQNNRRQENFEHSQIMVPNVISTHKYCKVCKTEYTDYLQHISSQSHHDKAIKNPYSTYISELQQSIQASHKRQIENYMQKRSLNTNLYTCSQIEMDMALSEKQSRIKQIFFEQNQSHNAK